MKVIKTAIEDVVIIEPDVFGDSRGYFFESYSQKKFDEQVRKIEFVQDNESKSRYGVLRGLHFQKGKYAQSKLVRVVKGRVLDVAVDIRKGSYIWTIRRRRTYRGEPSSAICTSRFCSRFFGIERGSRVPI